MPNERDYQIALAALAAASFSSQGAADAVLIDAWLRQGERAVEGVSIKDQYRASANAMVDHCRQLMENPH
jgi:hypothetical protein